MNTIIRCIFLAIVALSFTGCSTQQKHVAAAQAQAALLLAEIDQRKLADEYCAARYKDPGLEPIRERVEIVRTFDAPVPFEIAISEEFPSDEERAAIAKWAAARADCLAKQDATVKIPSVYAAQIVSNRKETQGRIGALIVALYQQKLTYGEFAQRRYEIGRDGVAVETNIRQAAAIADQQQQMRAQQIALQEQQNRLAFWNSYMQQLNARQPQSVRMNCTSTNSYGTVNTTCW